MELVPFSFDRRYSAPARFQLAGQRVVGPAIPVEWLVSTSSYRVVAPFIGYTDTHGIVFQIAAREIGGRWRCRWRNRGPQIQRGLPQPRRHGTFHIAFFRLHRVIARDAAR